MKLNDYQKLALQTATYPDKDGWFVDLCGNINRFGRVEDLKLTEPKPNLWQVESKGRQLTNILLQ